MKVMDKSRIKICGMTDASIVEHAIASGADAIGLIFFDKSPRNISLTQAKAIRAIVPAFVTLVGVFVNETVDKINTIAADVGLDLIQLHGDEGAEFAEQLNQPYLKAIRAKSKLYIQTQIEEHVKARSFLIDTFHEDKYGGTGEQFDLSLLPHSIRNKVIIAGGITPENVTQLLKSKPFAIDVNSGVESSVGVKDQAMISQLFAKITLAENQAS